MVRNICAHVKASIRKNSSVLIPDLFGHNFPFLSDTFLRFHYFFYPLYLRLNIICVFIEFIEWKLPLARANEKCISLCGLSTVHIIYDCCNILSRFDYGRILGTLFKAKVAQTLSPLHLQSDKRKREKFWGLPILTNLWVSSETRVIEGNSSPERPYN